jgi:hypothetical protein
MYFKEQRYEKAKSSSLASTHTVELPESGILDSISMYFRVTTANPPTVFPCNLHNHITKIEVIGDNDKILHSLSAEQELAKVYRKMGALPAFKQQEYNSTSMDYLIPIFFGRHFRDPAYALDLAQWDKVELQVTNDITTSTFTDSLSMETRLTTQEEAPSIPFKFLKQWQYDSKSATAAGQNINIKLPTKGKLRTLMVQLDPVLSESTGAPTADPLGDSYNWKLWFKDRALTIFDHRPRDLMRDEHRRLGAGISFLHPRASTTVNCDYHWGEVLSIACSPNYSGAAVLPAMGGSRDRFQACIHVGTVTDFDAIVSGVGLFHTFEIPWFVNDLEEEYLDLSMVSPVEIESYASNYYYAHKTILEKPIGQGPSEFA